MHCFSHVLHLSIIFSSIASYFITFMHFYGFFVPPWSSLIIFYVSRVKLSSFLYPLSIMTKRGRICGEIVVSFYKILHVRGRNTCPCKGEMCFILLGGVLISFFLYLRSCDHYWYKLYLSLSLCWCMLFLSPILTCTVSFLSLYTCF